MMRGVMLMLLILTFVACDGLSEERAKGQPQPTRALPEFHRYRVSIHVSTLLRSSTPDLDSLHDLILSAVLRFRGATWDASVIDERRFQPATALHLSSGSAEEIVRLDTNRDLDKVFLVTIEPEANRWRVSARELDRRSLLLGPMKSMTLGDSRELPETVARLCSELFRPIVRIEDVAGKTVYVRQLGGVLISPDPQFPAMGAGSLWLPFSRSIPTSDSPEERVQIAPWTYLKMESAPSADESLCRCALITGIRNPIPARRSMRVEALALAIPSTGDPTEVLVRSRGSVSDPLAAYDVDILNGDREIIRTTLTDRRGRITISGNTGHPLEWLVIRSGQLKLVQLPIVPGAIPSIELEIPGDASGLKVEAQLAILQSRLMELVVQRAFAMRNLKRATDDEKWDEIEALISKLPDLKSGDREREDLRSEVAAIRVREVKAAKSINDRISVRRIEKICDDSLELINRHLTPDPIRDLIDLSRNLRKTAVARERQIQENPEQDLKSLNAK